MSVQTVFQMSLVLGYLAWFLCFRAYILPWLKARSRLDAHRAIATLHSFRFIGLAFIVPGVTGSDLPSGFASFAAYADLATSLLALLALLTVRSKPLFWSFVVAFNVVGVVDFLVDYYHAGRDGIPAMAGELGSTFAIVTVIVPILMLTNVTALYWLARPRPTEG